MLKNIDYSKILFFDIETVPLTYQFSELDERGQFLWDKKQSFYSKEMKLQQKKLMKRLEFMQSSARWCVFL